MTERLISDAAELLEFLRERQLMLATAESCTGGMIAGTLTEVAGSSDVVDRGFVTYSNEAKQDMLGIPPALIREHGAVSEPVAVAMAEGALRNSRADIAVSVTGVAGPGGGTDTKPVGLVHIACARRGKATVHQRHVFADRGRGWIRQETVAQAFRVVAQQART
ncbi:MAG: competence damage-inducible protein A [Minwuia thermotolerans]|nr:MAG: competence damage-inducible protein A [Minwuia thermotolerans]